MVSPVCGFLPLRAERSDVENVPNPVKATSPLLLNVCVITSMSDFVPLLEYSH